MNRLDPKDDGDLGFALFVILFRMWAVWVALCLGVIGVLIYMIIHFLIKLW